MYKLQIRRIHYAYYYYYGYYYFIAVFCNFVKQIRATLEYRFGSMF